jgi:F0F1-type ATP synthase alpha subunit
MLIWSVTEGHADRVELKNMIEWKNVLLSYLTTNKEGIALADKLRKEGALSDELLAVMKKVVTNVNASCAHLFVSESE